MNIRLQPSKLNFSFGGHLATNSLGLVAKGFFLGAKIYVNNKILIIG